MFGYLKPVGFPLYVINHKTSLEKEGLGGLLVCWQQVEVHHADTGKMFSR